jgi:biopolymer transport protein TolR
MLVLLIIFMVTAPLLTQGIKVELPKAGAEPIEDISDRQPIVLSVDDAGNLYLDIGDEEERPKSATDIVDSVRKVLKASPQTPVLVKGDRRAEYGYVVGAMVLLQRAGADSVGFVTDPLDSYPVPE